MQNTQWQISVVIDGRSIVEAYTKRRWQPDFSNSPRTMFGACIARHVRSYPHAGAGRFKTVVEKKAKESTSAIIYDEKIRFGLIERSRQTEAHSKTEWLTLLLRSHSPHTHRNSVRRSLDYYSGGPQKVWRDRESAKLEDQVPKCVAGMMRIALKERTDEKARQERDLAWQMKIL